MLDPLGAKPSSEKGELFKTQERNKPNQPEERAFNLESPKGSYFLNPLVPDKNPQPLISRGFFH